MFDVVQVEVRFSPTVPHCNQALLIALCIHAAVTQAIAGLHCKLIVCVQPNTHHQSEDISKQINDKERVLAAMENPLLRSLVNKLITCMQDSS
jgi:hypothetical protein